MRTLLKNLIVPSLLLVWLVLVILNSMQNNLISYTQEFGIQEWISLGHIEGINPIIFMSDLLWALLGITFFSLACVSTGLRILKFGNIVSESALVQAISAFLIGEIVYSLIFLTIISVYRLNAVTSLILLLLGIGIGLPILKTFISTLRVRNIPNNFRQADKIILVLLVSILALTSLYSSARISYDATTTYFSAPKLMALTELPDFQYPKDPFIVSSFHAGILFTPLIQLFGDQAARMLSWANGLAILSMGLALAREKGLTARAQLLFATLVLTTTAFTNLLGDGKIEIVVTAQILCAVYWMNQSLMHPKKSIFLLTGTLIAFGIIGRPYNIFLLSVFTILYYLYPIYTHYQGKNLRAFILSALWMIVPALFLGLFHLLQNWLWLENPLAPLAFSQRININTWHWQFNPEQLFFYRLFYPFFATFLNTPQSLGNVSPLFLGFVPFLLIKPVRFHNTLTGLLHLVIPAIITVVLWITLFFTVVEIRYIFFLWILLFLPTAQIIENVIDYVAHPFRVILYTCITALLLFNSIRATAIAISTYAPIDKTGLAHCGNDPFCSFFQPINQTASPGDRILTLNAYRYYLRPDLFVCSTRASEYSTLENLGNQISPDFWVETYRQGFKFVIYENNYAQFHTRFGNLPTTTQLPDWLQVAIITDEHNKYGVVYQLSATNPPIEPLTACIQNSNRQWEIVKR